MADRRMVSAEIAEDVRLNRSSMEAQLLYLMMQPHLDRDGLMTGLPQLVWARVMPLRVELMDRTGSLIEELVNRGLLVRYEGAEGPVLFQPGFRAVNSNLDYGKERPSRYPPPPGWVRTEEGLVPEDGELAGRLAEQFHKGSRYFKALMAVAGAGGEVVGRKSGVGPDKVGSRSGVGPAQDQDQDQDQSKANRNNGGGVEEAGPLGDGWVVVLADDGEEVMQIGRKDAEAVVLEWMTEMGWKRRERYVGDLTGEEVGRLLAWLWAYQIHEGVFLKYRLGFGSRSPNLFRDVDKPVGFVRWNMAEGHVPELTGEEWAAAREYLDGVREVIQEV